MTIKQLIDEINKDIQHEYNKSFIKSMLRNNDGVARCQGRISAFEDVKSKLEKCIDDNVITIPQSAIDNIINDIRECNTLDLKDYGIFSSIEEEQRALKEIECVNETVEDVISELRDFFNEYTPK